MFNERSTERIQGVDPRLIEVLQLARQRTGIPFEISEGLRDAERQRQLVAEGKSQTMNSRHLHGNAVDVHIPDGKGGVNWDFEAYRPLAEAAKQAAQELGYTDLVWGGDWKTLKDGVHFQIGGSGGGTAQPRRAPQEAPRPALGGMPPQERAPAPQNALAQPERPELRLASNLLDPRAFMTARAPVNRLKFS